jgi:hypothetical protein
MKRWKSTLTYSFYQNQSFIKTTIHNLYILERQKTDGCDSSNKGKKE